MLVMTMIKIMNKNEILKLTEKQKKIHNNSNLSLKNAYINIIFQKIIRFHKMSYYPCFCIISKIKIKYDAYPTSYDEFALRL